MKNILRTPSAFIFCLKRNIAEFAFEFWEIKLFGQTNTETKPHIFGRYNIM